MRPNCPRCYNKNYETFVKVTKAKEFQIKFDRVKFLVAGTQKQALRELLNYMKPAG
jgi:hypothetical protein